MHSTYYNTLSQPSVRTCHIFDVGCYIPKRILEDMDKLQDQDDGYDDYIVYDGSGISRALRRPKDQLPMATCRNCSD